MTESDLPFPEHSVFDGNWGFNPRDFIVCNTFYNNPLLFMKRADWAAYNARARNLNLPILVEAEQARSA